MPRWWATRRCAVNSRARALANRAPKRGHAVASEEVALVVSGRAIRAEHRLHLAEKKARSRALATRAPKRGQAGSRRWRKYRAKTRRLEGRHRRRVAQATHEVARAVVDFAVKERIGTLVVGDPRGLLKRDAAKWQNLAVRNWRPGQMIAALSDKAALAGIDVELVDERGTSSTCPRCGAKVSNPKGRTFHCEPAHWRPDASRWRNTVENEWIFGRLWPAPRQSGSRSVGSLRRPERGTAT
jgi:IS605 OrfB family transposase